MNRSQRAVALMDVMADPFGERSSKLLREDIRLLGGNFRFETENRQLLRLVRSAYANLPPHRLAASIPSFRIRLAISSSVRARTNSGEPPPLRMLSGAGLLCGTNDWSSFVVVSPEERGALVAVSADMLRFAYHTRYELIEFAVFTLASRSQRLVPLHAACVGRDGLGFLILGPSGSGKSTLALHCLLHGFDFVSEDSVFVEPDKLLATGVANFLHVRRDSLHFLSGTPHALRIRRSPVIRRRSGVQKFEVDLRHRDYSLAASPLRLAGVVFTSAEHKGNGPLLRPLRRSELVAQLRSTQPYAANSAGWAQFIRNVSRVSAFELRRGHHPSEAVDSLRELLA
jgi:hypothetical protein